MPPTPCGSGPSSSIVRTSVIFINPSSDRRIVDDDDGPGAPPAPGQAPPRLLRPAIRAHRRAAARQVAAAASLASLAAPCPLHRVNGSASLAPNHPSRCTGCTVSHLRRPAVTNVRPDGRWSGDSVHRVHGSPGHPSVNPISAFGTPIEAWIWTNSHSPSCRWRTALQRSETVLPLASVTVGAVTPQPTSPSS